MQNKSRTIFIGDIHGCFKEFQLLLEKIKIKETDRVYIAGDFINRGPDSYSILKFLYEHQEQFKAVIGNNEVNFLRWLDGEYSQNPEDFVRLRNLIGNDKKLVDFIRNLPLYIEEKAFILLHGGKIPNKELKDHDIDEITRLREYKEKPWYDYYIGKKKIIYGHRALEGVKIRENTIGLDSGCIYGKMLTAYILETGEIVQQQALGLYIDLFKNKKIIRIF